MVNKYFETYFKKLISSGVSEDSCNKLKESFGESLNNASYNANVDSGMAYDGSLLEVVLTKLAVFAVKINELYPEDIRVDKKSLVKVCLLQHISKCQRMVKSNDEWRVKKLGEVYTYAKDMPAIGVGLHSLVMANNAGIEFTALEAEAMTIIDKNENDLQTKYHSSILTNIVKQANEMVYMTQKELEKLKNTRLSKTE